MAQRSTLMSLNVMRTWPDITLLGNPQRLRRVGTQLEISNLESVVNVCDRDKIVALEPPLVWKSSVM